MKSYQTILLAIIMMIACSVGYGRNSPPKTTYPLFIATIPSAIQNEVIVVTSMNTVYSENENIYSVSTIHADAMTPKAILLPAPKVMQLSRYIHYNVITDYSIKKIEPRARSSDILNQNKRC